MSFWWCRFLHFLRIPAARARFGTFWCHFGGVDFFIFCEFLQLEHDFGHSDVSFYVCVFIFATIQQPLALFDDFYVCIFSFLLLYSSLSHFFDADLGDFEGANPRTDRQTHRQTDTQTHTPADWIPIEWISFASYVYMSMTSSEALGAKPPHPNNTKTS